MSFANQVTRWVYTPNGVTTSFPYTNKALAAADLVVSWIAADGSALAVPSYSVTGVGNDSGGAVVFGSAPAATAGSRIVIERHTAAVQDGAFQDFLVEDAATRQQRFERSMALAQECLTALTRAILFSPLDPAGALVLPPPAVRANQALLFDSLGRPTVGGFMQQSFVAGAFVQGLLGSNDANVFLAGLGFSTFMRGLRGSADAPALLTAEGWSTFMQGLRGTADAAALKTALQLPATWTVGTDIDAAATIDLDSTAGGAMPGDERGLTTPGTAIDTINGAQRFVRLVAKADGITLTHNASSIVSRTGSNIVMRTGDALTLARTGAGQWREIAFEGAVGWKSAILSGVGSNTTHNVPHYLGKRVGAIRMKGALKSGETQGNWTSADFSGGKSLEFPAGLQENLGWSALLSDTTARIQTAFSGLGTMDKSTGATGVITPSKWDLWIEIDPR